MSECYVSAVDYRTHWKGRTRVTTGAQTTVITAERRGGLERRAAGHERRWEHTRGRRFRLADRRVKGR